MLYFRTRHNLYINFEDKSTLARFISFMLKSSVEFEPYVVSSTQFTLDEANNWSLHFYGYGYWSIRFRYDVNNVYVTRLAKWLQVRMIDLNYQEHTFPETLSEESDPRVSIQ